MNDHTIATEHTVTIAPTGKELIAHHGENLLTFLTENSILLRSDCGGKGVCKKCLLDLTGTDGETESTIACTYTIIKDTHIEIPDRSLLSAHIIQKAGVHLPPSFQNRFNDTSPKTIEPGIAVDLGTTTIAVYLLDVSSGTVLSSMAVKNPQAMYGDDVMSRVGYIGEAEERLERLQQLATGTIDWAARALMDTAGLDEQLNKVCVVGNPAMIHILLGVPPYSIGVSPYSPAFYEPKTTPGDELANAFAGADVQTLPQVSGFIGGDILAAAVASAITEEEEGTLLIDLGTNGELLLKGRGAYFATSCATGPAFEGATLSSGIQAIPGAIDRVRLATDLSPTLRVIPGKRGKEVRPGGICGSGIISAIAEFLRHSVIHENGAFTSDAPISEDSGAKRFILFKGNHHNEISVTQKDIRNVQLGKAALISGIEFLLGAAGITVPSKIIVAGAFGSHVETEDLLTLGIIPALDPDKIVIAGNSAGAGAIMTICHHEYLSQAEKIAAQTTVVNLADDPEFNNHFIKRLSFTH